MRWVARASNFLHQVNDRVHKVVDCPLSIPLTDIWWLEKVRDAGREEARSLDG